MPMRYIIPIVTGIAGIGLLLLFTVSGAISIEAVLLGIGLLVPILVVTWLAKQLIRPPVHLSRQRLVAIGLITGLQHFVASSVLSAAIFATVDFKRQLQFLLNVAVVLFFPMDTLSVWQSDVPIWVLFLLNAILWGGAAAAAVWLRYLLRQRRQKPKLGIETK